jgi:hypothetical protein
MIVQPDFAERTKEYTGFPLIIVQTIDTDNRFLVASGFIFLIKIRFTKEYYFWHNN